MSQNPITENKTEGVIITPAPVISQEATDFLKGTETAEKDALYADLFQQNENGEISRKQKTTRSALEIVTRILSFVVPVIFILALWFAFHAFVRGQENNSFAENYPFLCKYFHYDIEASDEDKGCKTAKIIEDEFIEKASTLEKNIVNQLSIFIPIKVAATLGESNEEWKFIRDTFYSKNNYNEIIAQFEKIKKESQSPGANNIICSEIRVVGNDTISTECDIYGGRIGETDTDGSRLGSSRIEAIRFMERLAKTQDSHFILQTPPTVLSVTSTEKDEKIPNAFSTKTTINISMKYVPFSSRL